VPCAALASGPSMLAGMFSQTNTTVFSRLVLAPPPVSGTILLFGAAAVVLLISPAIWLVNTSLDPFFESFGLFVFALTAARADAASNHRISIERKPTAIAVTFSDSSHGISPGNCDKSPCPLFRDTPRDRRHPPLARHRPLACAGAQWCLGTQKPSDWRILCTGIPSLAPIGCAHGSQYPQAIGRSDLRLQEKTRS